jgi:hypothetical protein
MRGGYTSSGFRELLDDMLPTNTFRSADAYGGRAVWVFEKDLWTVSYVCKMGAVHGVTVMNEGSSVIVSLRRDSIGSFPAVLKAVGAVSV